MAMLDSTLRNGLPSVWGRLEPSPGRQERIRRQAQLIASEASLLARMRALRSELDYLERQPITLGGEASIKEIREELMVVGLALAAVFQEHIRMDPFVANE